MGETRTIAPAQGYSGGIPWSVHLRAWDAYAKKYGRSQSAERVAERGGFYAEELDQLAPGWREEVSEITVLRAALEAARGERDALDNLVIEIRGAVAKTLEAKDAEIERLNKLVQDRDAYYGGLIGQQTIKAEAAEAALKEAREGLAKAEEWLTGWHSADMHLGYVRKGIAGIDALLSKQDSGERP